MSLTTAVDLRRWIRDVPDFPQPGILFRDITPLLADPVAFGASIDALAGLCAGRKIDVVAAAEARGFIFGGPLALKLNAGFVPIRKPGKLPSHTLAVEYDLEYGTDRLEIHNDALRPGQRVLLLDDVLATGGTMAACVELVERSGAHVVACAFLIELKFLAGDAKLKNIDVLSVITY
ncbi:MAG: adenine phosphoribosyltransferase [Planctomycetota bacterium]|nr:adenine phosphoribosyltransferase [Planctomycetota bacterium]